MSRCVEIFSFLIVADWSTQTIKIGEERKQLIQRVYLTILFRETIPEVKINKLPFKIESCVRNWRHDDFGLILFGVHSKGGNSYLTVATFAEYGLSFIGKNRYIIWLFTSSNDPLKKLIVNFFLCILEYLRF